MIKTSADIKVAAVMLFGADEKMLLVRKKGTRHFMQPGGKSEEGEPFPLAACRELHEEVGLELSPEDLIDYGVFSAAAANEPNRLVVAHVFAAFGSSPVHAAEHGRDGELRHRHRHGRLGPAAAEPSLGPPFNSVIYFSPSFFINSVFAIFKVLMISFL